MDPFRVPSVVDIVAIVQGLSGGAQRLRNGKMNLNYCHTIRFASQDLFKFVTSQSPHMVEGPK